MRSYSTHAWDLERTPAPVIPVLVTGINSGDRAATDPGDEHVADGERARGRRVE